MIIYPAHNLIMLYLLFILYLLAFLSDPTRADIVQDDVINDIASQMKLASCCKEARCFLMDISSMTRTTVKQIIKTYRNLSDVAYFIGDNNITIVKKNMYNARILSETLMIFGNKEDNNLRPCSDIVGIYEMPTKVEAIAFLAHNGIKIFTIK